MTDTPEPEHVASLAAERDAFRGALANAGFSDDGVSLRGSIIWTGDDHASHSALVEVIVGERFPFAPPSVTILATDHEFIPTFHIERDDKLCLWPTDIPVHNAPWRDAEKFIEKVSGWFTQTAMGWPNDDDADLERYLDTNPQRMVLYDDSRLENASFFRTNENELGVVQVGDKLPWRPNPTKMNNRGVRRRERNLLWVVDVGSIIKPIRAWQDIQEVTGQDLQNLQKLIAIGSVNYVLIRYRRGVREAALVLDFPGTAEGHPILRACESADQSMKTRTLRAGIDAPTYANKKVAIVGCGAVGSHVADMLFRSGVTHLTLIDPETYRPGNVIRHIANDKFIGIAKTGAVKATLAATGLDIDHISTRNERIVDPDQALELAREHDLMIDATADARATALLQWATEAQDARMISVCVQREGGIARVDRFPLWEGENHLNGIPRLPDLGTESPLYEQGCGSPVSSTPPISVSKAANIACQVALDELNDTQSLPATILEVIKPQPDAPYNVIGMITSK